MPKQAKPASPKPARSPRAVRTISPSGEIPPVVQPVAAPAPVVVAAPSPAPAVQSGEVVRSSATAAYVPPQVGGQHAPNYPATVAEVIGEVDYKIEVYAAAKAASNSYMWRGTVAERKVKFQTLHNNLTAIYGKTTKLKFMGLDSDVEARHGNGCYNPATDTITLINKLSVITYLHEFAHAMFGSDENVACSWSINLFRICWPVSFSKLVANGHMMVQADSIAARPAPRVIIADATLDGDDNATADSATQQTTDADVNE